MLLWVFLLFLTRPGARLAGAGLVWLSQFNEKTVTELPEVLKQEGKELNLEIFSPENIRVSTIMMDPPPLKLDRKIPNLKRVEIRIPAYVFTNGKGTIKVRLSGPE